MLFIVLSHPAEHASRFTAIQMLHSLIIIEADALKTPLQITFTLLISHCPFHIAQQAQFVSATEVYSLLHLMPSSLNLCGHLAQEPPFTSCTLGARAGHRHFHRSMTSRNITRGARGCIYSRSAAGSGPAVTVAAPPRDMGL